MLRLRPLITFVLLGLACTLSAEPLKVVVSVLPEKYFVERIGGDAVETEVLVPPGMSPHMYQPQAKQMVFLSRADLYFRIGMPFEHAMMHKLTDHFEGRIVDLRDGITLRHAVAHHHGEEEEHEETGEEAFDPHFWLSPGNAINLATQIAEALIDLQPGNREVFQTRRDTLIADLEALDQKLSRSLAASHGKGLLVFHPAWGYFADRYGMYQVAIEREGKAPGAKHIGELIRDSGKHTLPVLLVQPQVDHRVAETIAKELGLVIVEADPLAEDYIANLENLASTIGKLVSESQ